MSTLALAAGPDIEAIARSFGTPDIPGLKMVWLTPWGDVEKAHPWANIIVHQTEGPAGSARGGAQAQAKNPTRRGVMVWVETDGSVYWAVAENLVPTHTDGADRNDNKYIDNSKTYHRVNKDTSIGVEFAGNYPDVTRPATDAQIAAWRILVKVLRARYRIPLDHVLIGHAEALGDDLHLIGTKIALVERGDLALGLAQVEEQLLLVRGGAHFHERPGTQDVLLYGGFDPPHSVGSETEPFFGFEPLHRLHQADIAFRDDLGDRQAVAAIAHGDLGHEPEMAGDKVMCRVAIVMLAPALGEHVFLLGFQHRELADFGQVTGKTRFSVENR